MSVTFPPIPVNGQQVTDPVTGAIWVWNTNRWTPVGAGLISNAIASQSMGFVNKIRNPGMDIWQRGGVNVTPAAGLYTVDGWMVATVGANCAVGYSTAVKYGKSIGCMALNAASGLTDVSMQQRIESMVVAPLAGQVCTFQANIFNNTATPLTATLSSAYPNASDNWAGGYTGDLSAVNLQIIPAGGKVIVAYTFAVSPSAANGYRVALGFGGALNTAATAAIGVTDVDLRATPGVPLGLNNNPPPVELRPLAVELVNCQRYYETGAAVSTGWGGNTTSGAPYYLAVPFKVLKRVIATTTPAVAGANGFPLVAPSINNNGSLGFTVSFVSNASVNGGYYQFGWTASAEL